MGRGLHGVGIGEWGSSESGSMGGAGGKPARGMAKGAMGRARAEAGWRRAGRRAQDGSWPGPFLSVRVSCQERRGRRGGWNMGRGSSWTARSRPSGKMAAVMVWGKGPRPGLWMEAWGSLGQGMRPQVPEKGKEFCPPGVPSGSAVRWRSPWTAASRSPDWWPPWTPTPGRAPGSTGSRQQGEGPNGAARPRPGTARHSRTATIWARILTLGYRTSFPPAGAQPGPGRKKGLALEIYPARANLVKAFFPAPGGPMARANRGSTRPILRFFLTNIS
jgi:hypothetical protein